MISCGTLQPDRTVVDDEPVLIEQPPSEAEDSPSEEEPVLIDEATVQEQLSASRLTYRGMVLITLSETALLDTSMAAKDFFYSPASREKDEVTRIECAWFLWNLYSMKRKDPMLKTRYTARFSARGLTVSPVPDVAVGEKGFDAVLGCVEQEIMELPDGIHFYPDKTVSGREYLFWVKQLKR
jgi:hypothetical protein